MKRTSDVPEIVPCCMFAGVNMVVNINFAAVFILSVYLLFANGHNPFIFGYKMAVLVFQSEQTDNI